MRTAGTAIAISGLLLGSTVAQAAAPARQSSEISDSEAFAGTGFGWVIAALIAIGIILVIAGDDSTDAPTSP
ncbi:hypothetical protein GRI89_00690 [Altererythrobacter salegens]|uniref:Uncharacterized protein n=1 Tax=Croceibacterium salegens TaxID=1737568 RepID=A0A6I4SUD3_9SPHN|nr:hypothetical protein [Croceibacterium salegens]MXO58062.1 hypothetical protein [Croceibacterium salegens]